MFIRMHPISEHRLDTRHLIFMFKTEDLSGLPSAFRVVVEGVCHFVQFEVLSAIFIPADTTTQDEDDPPPPEDDYDWARPLHAARDRPHHSDQIAGSSSAASSPPGRCIAPDIAPAASLPVHSPVHLRHDTVAPLTARYTNSARNKPGFDHYRDATQLDSTLGSPSLNTGSDSTSFVPNSVALLDPNPMQFSLHSNPNSPESVHESSDKVSMRKRQHVTILNEGSANSGILADFGASSRHINSGTSPVAPGDIIAINAAEPLYSPCYLDKGANQSNIHSRSLNKSSSSVIGFDTNSPIQNNPYNPPPCSQPPNPSLAHYLSPQIIQPCSNLLAEVPNRPCNPDQPTSTIRLISPPCNPTQPISPIRIQSSHTTKACSLPFTMPRRSIRLALKLNGPYMSPIQRALALTTSKNLPSTSSKKNSASPSATPSLPQSPNRSGVISSPNPALKITRENVMLLQKECAFLLPSAVLDQICARSSQAAAVSDS